MVHGRRSRSRGPAAAAAFGVGVLAVLLTTAITIALDARPAAACSCDSFGDDQAFAVADVVFVGDVDAVVGPGAFPTNDLNRWTFAVDEVYKGDAAETQGVVSMASGGACGLEIPPRGTFVVFASRTSTPIEEPVDFETLHANLCGGTRPIADAPVPASFGVARAPTPGVGGMPPDPWPSPVLASVLVVLVVLVVVGGAVVWRRRRRSG